MMESDALDMLRTLVRIFPNHNAVKEDKETRAIYVDSFLKHDKEIMEIAIEKIKVNCKRMPSIAEITTFYNTELRNFNAFQERELTQDYCAICDNKGFELIRKEIGGGSYQFIAHCTCSLGEKWKYDGQAKQNRKNNYFVSSVNRYFEVEELKKMNIKRRVESTKLTKEHFQKYKELIRKSNIYKPLEGA